ncbi:polysaccharide deacetylase family protein [Lacrimispora sp.]|uniref:polysaccharide deacetylase family protein n=1 Tax=Lacrimispora sp. TaxID=2719234 RepID=UPI0032E3A7CA
MMENMKNIYICYPEGKHKALTMSYDDGRLEDRRLTQLFNQYGIKGTFHINSGLADQEERLKPEEWSEVYRGHEISCHTVLHPTIARCPLPLTALQVLEDRRGLERAAGYPVRGMSYPNGSYTEEIVNMLPSLGIEYCRVVGSTDDFSMPENYLKWKATCHHNHNLLENGRRFIELNKTQYLYLMYVWGHSYEFPRDNNWELMEEFCRMTGQREDIWYATNIQIVDYMNAAAALKYTIDADFVSNPSAMDVWISVDKTIVKVPGGSQIRI